MSNKGALEKNLRRRVDELLAEDGGYPEPLADDEWNLNLRRMHEESPLDPLDQWNVGQWAEEVCDHALRGREYATHYSGRRSTVPRRRAEPREVRDDGPAHWPLYWEREITRFQQQQREALKRVGRIPQRKLWRGLEVVGTGEEADLVVKADPLEAEDFVPLDMLEEFLRDLSAKYEDGEQDMLEYAVEPSEEHPLGAVPVFFRWGYWRKDMKDNSFGGDPDGDPLLRKNPLLWVKELAQEISRKTFLPEAEVVSFLLCNRMPRPPLVSGVLRVSRNMFDPGQDRLMFTLKIRDPLMVTPDALRDFYADWRRQVFGEAAAAHPWSVRLQAFVEWTKVRGHTWQEQFQLWNEWHPDHPYKSWQSMQRSYSAHSRR